MIVYISSNRVLVNQVNIKIIKEVIDSTGKDFVVVQFLSKGNFLGIICHTNGTRIFLVTSFLPDMRHIYFIIFIIKSYTRYTRKL